MSLSIYTIATEYQKKFNELYDKGFDIQTIADTLESLDLTEEFEEKALNLGAFIKNLELEVEAIKTARLNLEAREQVFNNKIGYFKNYLLYAMQAFNKNKLKGVEFNISLCKTSGKVEIAPGAQVPEEFCIIKKIGDKTKLKEALKAGVTIEGVTLVKEPSIRIK
jgi:hypothetical protein